LQILNASLNTAEKEPPAVLCGIPLFRQPLEGISIHHGIVAIAEYLIWTQS